MFQIFAKPCQKLFNGSLPIFNCCLFDARYCHAMAYVIGIVLALAISGLARLAGFDRTRVFYPMTLAVIALLYDLFAVMGGSVHALVIESFIATVFLFLAFAGFKFNLWLVVAGLATHGLMDMVHPHLVNNPGVPVFWPSFCMAYDIVAAAFLAWLLKRSTLFSKEVSPPK
jgi:hypothetical protein